MSCTDCCHCMPLQFNVLHQQTWKESVLLSVFYILISNCGMRHVTQQMAFLIPKFFSHYMSQQGQIMISVYSFYIFTYWSAEYLKADTLFEGGVKRSFRKTYNRITSDHTFFAFQLNIMTRFQIKSGTALVHIPCIYNKNKSELLFKYSPQKCSSSVIPVALPSSLSATTVVFWLLSLLHQVHIELKIFFTLQYLNDKLCWF